MQLALNRTVSLSLAARELDTCPAAALAVRAVITRAYIAHRGLPMPDTSRHGVTEQGIKLTHMSEALQLDWRINAALQDMQAYQVHPTLQNRLYSAVSMHELEAILSKTPASGKMTCTAGCGHAGTCWHSGAQHGHGTSQ